MEDTTQGYPAAFGRKWDQPIFATERLHNPPVPATGIARGTVMQNGRNQWQRFTAEHWLERAEEARVLADQMREPEARLAMLAVAEGYERLASHAAAMRAHASHVD